MKIKNDFFIIVFFILMLPVSKLIVKQAASQPIPQNNVPDSQYVSLIGRWAEGPCLAVAVNVTGTIACFGNGSYLEIVDISDPSHPSRLSRILLPAAIMDITISDNNYVYVANAGAGLRIIDISNPSSPIKITYFETLGIASGLAIDGTKIYLADRDSFLVIDISIPWQPKQMGICDTDGWASRVAISSSTYAYVADRQGGLKVIDVANPYEPKVISQFKPTSDVMDVAIYGTYGYLAVGSAGFSIIDISDPYNPSEVVFLGGYPFATGIAVSGTHAYLTDREAGLRIINISNPNNPDEIGYFDTEGSPHDITLNGNQVLLADGHNGLRMINVDNYSDPKEFGYFKTDRSSRGVAVDSNFAYLVSWEAGLRCIDISDPSNAFKINSLNLSGWTEDVVINENYAYLTNYQNGLQIIDITNPSAINAIGSITQNLNPKRVAIKDNYAYVADTTYGLHIVDISDTFQPILINSIEFPGKRADAITIKDNYVFLAAGNDGLIIVNIDTSSQPSLVGICKLDGTAISIDVDENLAYVGTLQKDLNVVNISDPINPTKVGYWNLYSPLYEIVAKDRYVYVANGASGLRVIDVINPSKPEEVGFYLTGSTAYGLTLDNKYIDLSCAENGLFILKFLLASNNKPPLAPILTLPPNKSFINNVRPHLTWQIPADVNDDLLHFRVELDNDGDWSVIDHAFESKKDTTGFSPAPPIIPGSGSANYTTQSSLLEDQWLWRVTAWDGLTHGEYSAIWSFTIDITAPVLNSLFFENPGYGTNWFDPGQVDSVTLVISYDELFPKISTLTGTVLPDTLYQTSLLGGINQQTRFNFSITNQLDGSYPFQGTIQDSAGNTGSNTAAIQFDSTPPFGFFSDAPDTINEGRIYVVHVLGTNDSLGCGVAKIYLDVFTDPNSIPISVQDSMIGISDPGVYYYRYFAMDHLGNQGEIKTDTTVVKPVYSQAPIFPISPMTEISAGDEFWIDIQVGTQAQPVENLYSVDFNMNYSNTQYIDFVSPDSILPGDWFGTDANISSQVDDSNGKVNIDISRKSGISKIDGFGALARIKFISNPNTPDQTTIQFTIPSVTASDSEGYSIDLIPHDTIITIIQPFSDFIMTVVPDSQAIGQGDSADFIVSFEPLGVFDSQIKLSIAGIPAGMQAIYPSQPFDIPVTDSIIFSTSDEIASGIYYPIITATGGEIIHADTVGINVLPISILSDFSMAVLPDSQNIQQGESTEFNLIFQPIGAFDAQISLEISNQPEGMESVYPSAPFANDTSFNVTFSADDNITAETYKPIFKATGGGITYSDTVIIMVLPKSVPSDFSMTVVPDSQTIYQGEGTEFTSSFRPIGDFDSQISLDISNLPTGMETLYPSDPFASDTSFSIKFSTTPDIKPGSYHPTITATGGGKTHRATVKISVLQRPDFIMIIEPDSQTVSAGDSIVFYISFQPVGVFNSQITVEVSNVPTGMSAIFNSRPFGIPRSFTISFNTLRNIPPDVYYPTVTASGGGVTHQETVAINVLTSPSTIQGVSVLPNPFTPNNDGFNDYTEFQYPEPSSGSITISIFDINGRKITEIRESRFWYGKDAKDREVKPGAYIYVVKNGEKVIAKGVIGLAK